MVKIEFGRSKYSKSRTSDPINISDKIVPTQTWRKVEGTFKTPTHEIKYSQFIISLEEGIGKSLKGFLILKNTTSTTALYTWQVMLLAMDLLPPSQH